MKNRQQQYQALSHQAEYAIIRKDLLKVLILNAIYLALILGLYFADQKTGFLQHWFSKVLHF
jgi:hypothetical protein